MKYFIFISMIGFSSVAMLLPKGPLKNQKAENYRRQMLRNQDLEQSPMGAFLRGELNIDPNEFAWSAEAFDVHTLFFDIFLPALNAPVPAQSSEASEVAAARAGIDSLLRGERGRRKAYMLGDAFPKRR